MTLAMNSKFLLIFVGLLIREGVGHGMMLEPPNRSSVWRVNPKGLRNYDDNANFCGGAFVQHEKNGGKCGVCGDNYADPHPQRNENTGKYGAGLIAGIYEAGSVIDVRILLTANHLGTFSYSLCKLEDPTSPESGEECFVSLTLADGSKQYHVSKDDHEVINQVKLPEEPCERCVLRWHYKAGNNWGVCEDGTGRLGCGPQETFRSCADIVIQ